VKEVSPASSIQLVRRAALHALIDQAWDFGGFPKQGYVLQVFSWHVLDPMLLRRLDMPHARSRTRSWMCKSSSPERMYECLAITHMQPRTSGIVSWQAKSAGEVQEHQMDLSWKTQSHGEPQVCSSLNMDLPRMFCFHVLLQHRVSCACWDWEYFATGAHSCITAE